MTLKPWRSVVDPREDLRKGEALDAAECAVHLDMVQSQRGNAIYWQPEQFFSRTFLTRNLLDFAVEAVRRLAGIATASLAGFNLTTQFSGGKTHALTLLYHLARSGPAAAGWPASRRPGSRSSWACASTRAAATTARRGVQRPGRRSPSSWPAPRASS